MVRIQGLRCQDVACNLCRGSESKHLFTVHSFNVVKCLNCGLVYLNPMPYPEDIANVYDSREYYCKKGHQDETPLGYADYAMLEGHLTFVANELLRPVRHIKTGRLLDVGCSMGIMLNHFRELGWDTYGVDISTYATEYARDQLGLKIFTGVVEKLDLPESYFDLVTMVLTIEHIPSPRDTLEALHRLMKPGAVIIVATHDIDGPWPRIVKGRWRHLNVPEHLYFFSKSTLKRMLEETGFSTFRITETATIAAATSNETLLRAPIRFLHRYRLMTRVAPVLRSLHAINRMLNLSDDVTLYSRRV